jgi:hypothetical protein
VCGGTIEKLDGNTLVIKSLDGTRLDMKLADNAVIIGVAKASLADIRQGSYISSGAVPQPDGTQSAGMEKIPEFIAGVRLLLSGIIIATIFYLYSDAKLHMRRVNRNRLSRPRRRGETCGKSGFSRVGLANARFCQVS